MKIWQIEIGTKEGGANMEVVNGVAENAQEAIDKAMKWAKTPSEDDPDNTGYENPYPSRVTEIGEQVF